MNGLFRQQALDSLNKRLYGEISLAQPLSLHLMVVSLMVIIAVIAVFLNISRYARKETVRGYLLPDSGIIKTYPERSGIVSGLYVQEGDVVSQGQAIAVISIQSGLASGQELSERLLELLETQRLNLLQERGQQQRLHDNTMAQLARQQHALRDSLAIAERQSGLLQQRHQLLLDESRQYESLLARDFLSDLDYQTQVQKRLIVEQEMEESNSKIATITAELARVEAREAAEPIELELRLAGVENRLSDVQRQQHEIQNNFSFVVSAPEAGTIAAVSAAEGEYLTQGRPLVHILPNDSELVAELLLPSRSAGFVKEGDEARLRFDAFPYQRFGFVNSTVSRIDDAIVLEGEISLPIRLPEPVYRMRTRLQAQTIEAYGSTFTLKSGMMLQADIILEQRSLFHWLLHPIYSLRGRIG